MTRSSLLFTICFGVFVARAGAADYNSLLDNSPFAPVGAGAAAGGDQSVEFRGLVTEQGATYFSIYDTATKRAAWVGLNESGHPFVVRGYNSANDTVTVELNGHNLNLGLKHAQVLLAAAPRPAEPAGATPPNEGLPRGRWMANMVGPEGRPDPKRMQAFIEEMRRRRAERMQSFNQGQIGPGAGGQVGAQPTGANMPIPTPNPSGPVPVDNNGNPTR